MSDIYTLLHLAHKKNEVNRRRRRFYYIMNGRYKKINGQHVRVIPTHISAKDAVNGYIAAKREMKAMTPEMRRIRSEIGAEIRWGDGGNIQVIKAAGDRYFKAKDFKMYSEFHLAEKIILGE